MEKINIAELLKDCPKGMELDSTMFEDLEFDRIIDGDFLIRCRIKNPNGGYYFYYFTEYGCWLNAINPKCVIFPKGKNTWEGFQRPFKDGDIVATYDGKYIAIIKKNGGKYYACCHLNSNYFHIDQSGWFDRLATEEEKQKLFQIIKDKGYKWNDQTKRLEVLITPNFKVGDIIQDKDLYKVKITNVDTENSRYKYESLNAKIIGTITFIDQDNWELSEYQAGDHFIHPTDPELFAIIEIRGYGNYKIQNLRGSSYVINKHNLHEYLKVSKWNPKWFKPFDKVLVRDSQHDAWVATLFSHIGNNEIYPYIASCTKFKYCIPYNNETKHLVGTTNEAPEFYINW